mmetsp:Transcript_6895/g.10910  ORF Transcript_6895/g.10910 Transcript_6895/m.10910 type:complete len:173 (-) Transcript_6895:215-733(-)
MTGKLEETQMGSDYFAEGTHHIGLPVGKMFDLVNDIGTLYKWHCMVESSELCDKNKPNGLGAARIVKMYDANRVTEEIVECVKDEKIVFHFSNYSMPFTRAFGCFTFKSTGENSCTVSMRISYNVKYGLFGSLIHYIMLRRNMEDIIHAALDGAEYHALTGKQIHQGWKKQR